jgi:hypothetical protein
MELFIENRDRPEYHHNSKRFYIVKSIMITISVSFLIATIAILGIDKNQYQLCNQYGKDGNLLESCMILLIIYHTFDLISLIYNVLNYKSMSCNPKIKWYLALNNCLGLFLFFYIQGVYYSNNNKICKSENEINNN